MFSSSTQTSPSSQTAAQSASSHHSINMQKVAAIILGGGQGTRLFPLTLTRCKPAISFGGRYRLVDVPVSNSINSGIRNIFVVTQFLSSSLHQHISRTYRFDKFSGGFIELLAAEQKPSHCAWFQGTADAVRQNLEYFMETPAEYFLVLSGDQLYNIDFRHMLAFAQEKDADLTIASLPVNSKDASRMGIMKVDEQSRVKQFIEKPSDPATLQAYTTPAHILESQGIASEQQENLIGSMGIYLFKRQALLDLLAKDPREDFGKHLIPSHIPSGGVFAYLYDGYWEDIGTIESFYEANLNLTEEQAFFDCYDENHQVFTTHYSLPGPKIRDCHLKQSILCEGARVEADEVTHSILGVRSLVGKGSIIRDSYIVGNDYYEPPVKQGSHYPETFGIEENCIIQKAIVDKNVHIGKGVQLINRNQLDHYNGDHLYIRDGIIIVTRGAKIPDGFVL